MQIRFLFFLILLNLSLVLSVNFNDRKSSTLAPAFDEGSEVFTDTLIIQIDPPGCHFDHVLVATCSNATSCINIMCEFSLKTDLFVFFQLLTPIYNCNRPDDIFQSSLVIAVQDTCPYLGNQTRCTNTTECVDIMCQYNHQSGGNPMIIVPLIKPTKC